MAANTRRENYAAGFAASSIAPALAAIFTNPIEVCKIRQQMDANPRSLLSTLHTVWAANGVEGLQAGLQMALVREASKSFFRIGCFTPILNQLHDPSQGPAPLWKRMGAGMSSGAIAALVCNPIELVKTRQQGSAVATASGAARFSYQGPMDGLRKLHAAEGAAGMWRGTGISMLRSAMVTGPHLTTYTGVKDLCIERSWMRDAPPLHILASLCGGFTGVLCNQPLDVVRNRLYNQPTGAGALYDGAADCARKLAQSEGVLGFYRGFWSHYIRVGPHYVLTFTFLEQIKKALGA